MRSKRGRYTDRKVIGLPLQLGYCGDQQRIVGVPVGSTRPAWSDILSVTNRLRVVVSGRLCEAAGWVSRYTTLR